MKPAAQDFASLARTVSDQYVPSLVLAGGPPEAAEGIALLADRPMQHGKATAYVCRGYVCDEPVTEPRKLYEQLQTAVAPDPRLSS